MNYQIGLLYPALAFLIALSWAQNHYRVRGLASYIKKHFDDASPEEYGWESFVDKRRSVSSIYLRSPAWPHGGVLLGTQLLAVGTSVLAFRIQKGPWTELDTFFVSLDAGLIFLTFLIIVEAERKGKAIGPGKNSGAA